VVNCLVAADYEVVEVLGRKFYQCRAYRLPVICKKMTSMLTGTAQYLPLRIVL